ncbi:MAG: glycosyltransferase family 2 protein [Paludibacteraceae bacterium]|nr:glycosyltransferase family 2 protein [Paludibacteraceae bacterium]
MEIAVLLASYNGSKRLPRLLDSILAQTNHDWRIYAHDDGSSDATVDLLDDFAEKHPGKLNVIGREVTRLGAKGNFMWLLEHVQADYYMFCDQDDIWMPDKIQTTFLYLRELESSNPESPVCVHTDLSVCDADYNIVHPSLWKVSKVVPQWQEHPDRLLVANCVTGCTMMFNERVRLLSLPMPGYVPMHDLWVAYQTVANGGVLSHIAQPTMLYCQHGGNEVGAVNVESGYVLAKLKSLKRVWQSNVSQYKIAKKLRNMSVFKYVSTKFIFEFKRMF